MDETQLFDGLNMAALSAIVLFYLGLAIALAALVYFPYRKLPEQYQEMPAWCAWLLAVPLVGLIMQWLLLAFKIPEAFQRYFADHPPTMDMGDCGKAMGLGTAICATLGVFIGPIGLVALVFYILFIIKLHKMAGQIPPAQ